MINNDEKNLDVLTKSLQDVEKIQKADKRRRPVKRSDYKQNKINPESEPVDVNKLLPEMILGSNIFKKNQLIMEVHTRLDDKKINFLQKEFNFVYIYGFKDFMAKIQKQEEKDQDDSEQNTSSEPEFDLDNLIINESFSEILTLLNDNKLKKENILKVLDAFKEKEQNEYIDEMLNTVLQFYDIEIRENVLKCLEYYDENRFYDEIFKLQAEFDFEEYSSNVFVKDSTSDFFKNRNKTFMVVLSKFFDNYTDEKKDYILKFFKNIDAAKTKKLLILYTKIPETKDVAFSLLSALGSSFVAMAGKKKVETAVELITYSKILKEMEARTERKTSILNSIADIKVDKGKLDNQSIQKKVEELNAGEILVHPFYLHEKLVFPGHTVLAEDNIDFLKQNYKNNTVKVYCIDDVFGIFNALSGEIKNPQEKIDMFIYFLQQSEGKNELDVLALIMNFPDKQLKIEAIKYMIVHMSPKKFIYIIEALKQDIPEINNMLKTFFETTNDIFSLKLFLDVVSKMPSSVVLNKIKKIFTSSDTIKNMIKTIIRTANPVIKKISLYILG